jgi:hypothetical protein
MHLHFQPVENLYGNTTIARINDTLLARITIGDLSAEGPPLIYKKLNPVALTGASHLLLKIIDIYRTLTTLATRIGVAASAH